MTFDASLESVKSRKDVSDNVIQTVVFHVWGKPEEIAKLNAFYKLPLQLTLEVKE